VTQLTEIIERMLRTLTTEELVDMFPEFQEGRAEHGEIAVKEDDLRLVICSLETCLEDFRVLGIVSEQTRTTVMEALMRLKTCVVVQTKRVPKEPPAA